MTVLSVPIDEKVKREYGLNGNRISFEELRLRILGKEGKAALRRANEIAKRTGLSKMTMKEIDAEIKAARDEKRRR